MEVSNETADKLEEFAEENELEYDDVVEQFKENYENVKEKATNVDGDYLETLALRTTRTQELAQFQQNVEGVEMLTIGGDIRNWSNGDTFVGKALVDAEPNEPGRPYISTIIIDEGDVNLGEVMEAFDEVGNIVTGEFSVQEAHNDEFRVLNSGEDTDLNVTRPDERGDIIGDIREYVPETDIENVAGNLSQVERNDDGNVYPASFGVDIRRMTVDIYDGYRNPSEGNGTYTVRDDTVFDEDDIVESPVFDADNAGDNATPGLTCWIDPGKMEYGSGSVVEFFGTVSKNEDGIVSMNVDGVVPILVEGEYDGYTDESEPESPEREETSSNVDRKSI